MILVAISLACLSSVAHADRVQVIDLAGTPVPDAVVLLPDAATRDEQISEADPVVDQIGKRFVPFVSVVQTGSKVRFPNSDDTRHSVYSFSDAKTFELKLYHANDADPILFDKSGLVTLGCNVHDHMKAYIWVTHQDGVVTDSNGQANFTGNVDMPAEVMSLDVWHPQLTSQTPVTLTINNGILILPITWDATDPQAAKSRSALENKFKSFKRNAN